MAASASANPSFLLLLLALVVVAAGAREAPASIWEGAADGVPYTGPMSTAAGSTQGPASAPAPHEGDGYDSGSFDRHISAAAAGPATTQAPAWAPVVPLEEAADGVGTVTFDRTVPRDSRRCDSDARWTDQLCRTVCGMFKFHGYEFAEAAADEGQEGGPRCCCCPAGATCVHL